MKPTIINADYMIASDEIPEVDVMTEIHFSRFGINDVPGINANFINKDAKKIFCHVNEPTTSRWVETPDNIIKHHKQYDKIVSSNSEVIKNCKPKCVNESLEPVNIETILNTFEIIDKHRILFDCNLVFNNSVQVPAILEKIFASLLKKMFSRFKQFHTKVPERISIWDLKKCKDFLPNLFISTGVRKNNSYY